MSLSLDLQPWEPQLSENDRLSQHLIQPDAAYWLTLESPIARAVSIGVPVHSHLTADYARACVSMTDESRHSLDNFNATVVELALGNAQSSNSMSHLHISELETGYTDVPSGFPWPLPNEHMVSTRPYSPVPCQHVSPCLANNYAETMQFQDTYSPYSTPSLFNDSPLQTPCLSSPELYSPRYYGRAPRSSPNYDYEMEDDNEEDVSNGKPYARLIYEALFQAPGHRMMLRDLYEWFEQYTNKARGTGSNGWQNSIRHNLSMNKAFENDKTQSTNARGQPKKATSVWFLTQEALMHGVQSTTRYRKTGSVRKSITAGSPDFRRQRSGAKGGRAARRAARLRRLEQSHSNWVPTMTHEDVTPFNHLVHAAHYLNDPSAQYDSNAPTPSESFPYTPESPMQSFDCSADDWSGGKLDTMAGNRHELRGKNMVFQHSCDTQLEEPW